MTEMKVHSGTGALLSACCLTLWTGTLLGQTSSVDSALAATAQGGVVYVGGLTHGTLPGQVNAGGKDAFVRTYDPNGNELWTRQFGSAADDQVMGLAADATGIYVVGLTYGALPGQTYLGQDDAFIRKYDLNGNELWTQQFGTKGYDRATAVAVDGNGVYVAGATSGVLPGQTRIGGEDAFLRMYDPDGNELWTCQFGTTGLDRAYGVTSDATGVYVAGRTDGVFSGQTAAGGIDAFLGKFDTFGNLLWVRQFGTPRDDRGWAVAVDATGVYIAGRVEDPLPGQTYIGDDDAYIRKYDADGNELWTVQFGTTSFDRVFAMVADSFGIHVAGVTEGTLPGQTNLGANDSFLCTYDTLGNEVWTRQFGTKAVDVGNAVTSDSTGIYVAGRTGGKFSGQTHATSSDVYLVKYDFNGNMLWVREFGT